MADLGWLSLGIYLWGALISLDLYLNSIQRQGVAEAMVVSLLSWGGVPWVIAIAVMEEGCE
jgi:hypothetical protein